MDILTITHRRVGEVSIVDIDGNITMGDATRQLRDTLRKMVGQEEKQVILDLAKVSRIDSSGLGEIVAAFAVMGRLGGIIKLLNISDRVSSLMTITKLHTVFEIFDSEETALSSFTGRLENAETGASA